MERYIGLDVHAASTTCAVIDARGKHLHAEAARVTRDLACAVEHPHRGARGHQGEGLLHQGVCGKSIYGSPEPRASSQPSARGTSTGAIASRGQWSIPT